MKRSMQLAVVLSLITLVACNDYGKRIKVEGTKGEIYYKEGVTREEATEVGNVLKDGFLGNEKAASVQVSKDSGVYTVRFVYDRDYYEKNPGFDEVFRSYAEKISKSVFNGQEVNIALATNQFKDYKRIPFVAPVKDIEESGLAPAAPAAGPVDNDEFSNETREDVTFHWKNIEASDRKVIADYIMKNGAFSGGTAHLYITMEGNKFLMQFPVKDEYKDDAATIAEVGRVSREIKDNVFASNPFTFQIIDTRLNEIKSFDY